MTSFSPLYLLTAYAPRSIDPDEYTVLTPVAGAPHAEPFRVATRDFGKAVRCASASQYLIRNPVGTWPTNAITIEGMARIDAGQLGVNHFLFSYATAGQAAAFQLQLATVAGPNLRLQGTANNVNLQDADNYPTDGQYHHVAFTWQGSDGAAKLYIDGALAHSGTIASGYSATAGGSATIGVSQSGVGSGFANPWLGEIDEVRVYSRVLSATEIKQHAGGIYLDETGLCARWGFDLDGVPALGRDSAGLNDLTAVGIDAGTIDTPLHFRPYMDPPTGRNGRIDAFSRELDTGEWTFPLIDRKLPNDSSSAGLKRWLSAYLGNLKGQPRLAGLRFYAQESLDNGLTVPSWRTGRITKLSLGPVLAYLTGREITDEAKMPVFVGNPHASITYAARPSLCPIGMLGSDWGTIKAVVPLTGTAREVTVNAIAQAPAIYTAIVLDGASTSRKDNIGTRQLLNASAPSRIVAIPSTVLGLGEARIPDFGGPLRARVKHLSGANSGSTGDYKAAAPVFVPGANGKRRLSSVYLEALSAGDVNQLAIPAAGVNVEITLWSDTKVSKENPLFINDVHFATFLQDLCDGKFGYLYRFGEAKPASKSFGDPKRSVTLSKTGPTINGVAFDADDTFPKQRYIVTDSDELIRWVEKNILKPLNVALYPNEHGALVLADLRLPSSVSGLPTFTETDLARDYAQGEWEYDRDSVITRVDFTWHSDRILSMEDIERESEEFPDMPPGGIESSEHPFLVIDVGQADIGDKSYDVDMPGFRTMDGETLQGQSRADYLRGKMLELAHQWRRPLGWGKVELPVTLRRSGAALSPAGLALVTFQHVPDPASWQRGGTRLVRALEVSPSGATRAVRFLDLGANVVASVPSLAQPAQETNNTYAGVTSALTLNGNGQAAEVRYAVTDTGVGTVPADASPLWTVAGRFTATATVTIRGLAPNRRVWVQGRTLPDYIDSYLPSAWVNAAGTGRVDTAALPAPSSPTSSLITGRSFRVSWTNGAADLATELLLATPTGDPRVVVARVSPGATRFDFPGDTGVELQLSTTYRVGVRHVGMNEDGYSAEVTVDVTTTGSATAAPATGGFEALVGVA